MRRLTPVISSKRASVSSQGCSRSSNLCSSTRHRAIKGFNQAEQLSEDELIVFPAFTLQRLDQLVVFRLQTWVNQVR
jgi:Ser/Thr protein kinase RdoA (MazF antagonist)